MKVKMNCGTCGYSGTLDGLVFYRNRGTEALFARRYVYPRPTEENERVASISRQIFALQPSAGYKNDLKVYLLRYNRLQSTAKPIRSWVTLYTRLMYAVAKADQTIDLKIITRDEIYTRDLPCISVTRAVEAGLLTPVEGWERMEELI